MNSQLALPVSPDDCLDCGIGTHAAGEYYMCIEAVWLEAHPADEGMLCVGCVEQRLGRRLTRLDFADVPLNRSDWAKSSRLLARLA